MRLFIPVLLSIAACAAMGDAPRDAASTAVLPKNLFASLAMPCRCREAFSFKMLEPMDLAVFWELFPKLPGIADEEGVDALIVPFTQPRATDIVLFRSLDAMNQVLGRPTTYQMEVGKLRSHFSVARPEEEYKGIIGHDLEENLLRMFAIRLSEEEGRFAIPERGEDTLKLCREREFWKEYLIPRIEKSDHLVLVGGSFEDPFLDGTLSHEMLHAVFYTDERIQTLVAGFWDANVVDEDKRIIVDTLGREGYETPENTKMLYNEFFAYLLERTASKEILKRWVPVYAAELRKRLADNAIVLP
jgi:hypothetical protein